MSEQNRLSEAIFKNLEKIKKDSKQQQNSKEENADQKEESGDPDEMVLGQLTRLSQPKGDFEFSANRLFFDDVYFRHSRLIRM